MEIKPEPVALARLARDLIESLRAGRREESLEFRIDVAPECPAYIETDGQRLEQILRNLLSNAFKFTERGKVELSSRRAPEGQIALSVADTGIGISDDKQKAVFEPFRQADGTISRKYGGTGLGLSICRELARLLGGTLALRSVEGQGSTFTVLVPESYSAAKVQPRAEAPPASDGAASGRGAATSPGASCDPSAEAACRRRPGAAYRSKARPLGHRGRPEFRPHPAGSLERDGVRMPGRRQRDRGARARHGVPSERGRVGRGAAGPFRSLGARPAEARRAHAPYPGPCGFGNRQRANSPLARRDRLPVEAGEA